MPCTTGLITSRFLFKLEPNVKATITDYYGVNLDQNFKVIIALQSLWKPVEETDLMTIRFLLKLEPNAFGKTFEKNTLIKRYNL